jgi:hypothetical protein
MTIENLSANEAAQLLGLRPATLAKMRCWGGGPPSLSSGDASATCATTAYHGSLRAACATQAKPTNCRAD